MAEGAQNVEAKLIQPSLLGAVVGTQLLATLIAVYGVFMAPIGWERALLVWGYALAWFLVNDRAKLIAYRVFDPEQHGIFRWSWWPGMTSIKARSDKR